MSEYIKKEDLYRKVAELEGEARDYLLERFVDQMRFVRLDERTRLKFLIADFPTADVVEVVRCKDCKHMAEDALLKELCCPHSGMVRNVKADDGFCSYGERREP